MRWKLALAAGCALIAVSGVALLWYAHTKQPSGADATDQALVTLGQAVYAARCAACHGVNLEGQPDWRNRLPAPPHNAEGYTWHHADRQLFDITKNGASGLLPGYHSSSECEQNVLPRPCTTGVCVRPGSPCPGKAKGLRPGEMKGGQ